ncbi:hypothetical protein IFM89_022242 [Coptis chinensis]|uniref:Uncharacterized protein n=1 Tax=Coptis chinensis TaxID=261450 RepID=A0A835GXB1_9MAGN|nr:hypothetical protein IFM89_022242 [Coptis chinensis]
MAKSKSKSKSPLQTNGNEEDEKEDGEFISSSTKKDKTKQESYSSEEEEEERKQRRGHKHKKRSSRSYSDTESSTGESDSDSEEERRRRRRKRRRREEREYEKEKRRKRKEKEKRRKKKGKDVMEKKKNKEGKKGAVTNSWGKYGIIREIDMWNKRPEFTAWLLEVKQVNLESLPNWEEKQMFKQFMEDHNTATFPSKKYYDLDAYHKRKMEKEMKKGYKILETERTVFNDEEQRRHELMLAREKQKEEQVVALKRSMQSGMAQAMKEQAQLREEMALHYKLGNSEAAAAIQRRLDPDVAM